MRTHAGSSAFVQRRLLVLAWVIIASVLLALLPPGVEAGRSGYRNASGEAKPAPIARVRYIKRGLTVRPPSKKSVKGKVKMPLYSAYDLRTRKQQLASLGFQDGTVLHMNQRTDLALRSPTLTYVNGGQVDEILTPGTNHRVQTATAIAGAIGTEFLVRESVQIREVKHGTGKKRRIVREKRHTTTFIVVEGSLQVRNSKGSIVVKTDQKTTVHEGKAPQPPVKVDAAAAVSWTRSIPAPTVRAENLALDANGGKVVAFSSQAAPAPRHHRLERTVGSVAPKTAAPRKLDQAASIRPWAATNINDGRIDAGWMSGKGQVTNQWVKVRLRNGNAYRISGVVIEPSATNGADPSDAVRTFEIRVSTTGTADADFTTIFSGACLEQHGLQRFTFPQPVAARYVELYALHNHRGNDGIAVAELEVVGSPAAVVPPPPVPTPSLTATATLTPTATIPPPPGPPPIPPSATLTPTTTPVLLTITPFPTSTLVPTSTPTSTLTATATVTTTPVGTTTAIPTVGGLSESDAVNAPQRGALSDSFTPAMGRGRPTGSNVILRLLFDALRVNLFNPQPDEGAERAPDKDDPSTAPVAALAGTPLRRGGSSVSGTFPGRRISSIDGAPEVRRYSRRQVYPSQAWQTGARCSWPNAFLVPMFWVSTLIRSQRSAERVAPAP